MFGSGSIAEHLARGLVGAAALAGAALWTASYPYLWLVAVPVALVAFRGCPMCWTVGLVETVAAAVRGGAGAGTRIAACARHRAAPPPPRD